MNQTFTSLVLDIKESLDHARFPTELIFKLQDALEKAQQLDAEWVNDLYEQSDEYFHSISI